MADVGTIVQRWQAGDERAAELLYNRFRERTFRLAFGLLGDSTEAEEAAQDSLSYALLNIARYDPRRASFGTWLHAITVSRCRDRYRRHRISTFSLQSWLGRARDVADPTLGPEGLVIQFEARSEVWQAVRDLKPSLREAVLLRYWAGHTYQEIGEILGCPLRTAQSRVRLAFQQLEATIGSADLNGLILEEDKQL